MTARAGSARGYIRQADADFRAWELYERHPESVAGECHELLFLQMACEKLCKAHLISNNTPPQELRTSHALVAGTRSRRRQATDFDYASRS